MFMKFLAIQNLDENPPNKNPEIYEESITLILDFDSKISYIDFLFSEPKSLSCNVDWDFNSVTFIDNLNYSESRIP